jgi:L-amino acid N-acyltransferase YncA
VGPLAAVVLAGLIDGRRATAGITLPNEASVGLHAALGFETVGTFPRIGWKNGAWYDVAWMQRDL